ncbi:hypothetical protein COCNU_13G007100 [Cocos nucifera]|uniref:Uncharacterized protein n=1 Tax=Cocos nucifera TaxID=13894 RepID=A0A8K0ITM4_COCNU|nr:hypothetical protein COCNU_13G007100 [Cocos nucifera]
MMLSSLLARRGWPCLRSTGEGEETITELEKELDLREPAIMALEEKRIVVEEATKAAEEKATTIEATVQDAITQVISDFRNS